MSAPLRIYPTVNDCLIKTNLVCSIAECSQTFKCESNLNFHLSKTHRVMELKSSSSEKQYYCPEGSCSWSCSKYFINMKRLRQHYLKMHTAKLYSCVRCRRSFPSQLMLTSHSNYCDVTFACLDCKASYGSYETLKTHCRRKSHKILNKNGYKERPKSEETKSEIVVTPCALLLTPNTRCSTHNNSNTVDGNSQTCTMQSKVTQIDKLLISQAHQHTQTASATGVLPATTQTIENSLTRQYVFEDNSNYKHMNTQTERVASRDTSCNTSFDINDCEFSLQEQIEKITSSTQTHWPSEDVFGISPVTTESTHTDTSDLLADSLSTFDTNYFNCNTETQTDLMFENEIFNSDYYSHTYTQTCDDILNDLNGFSNIQTQTILPEALRSVESQTLMSSADRLCPIVFKDIANSQTQTDAEFRQMLEIINS